MIKESLQVVQLVHPGFEYQRPEYVGRRDTRSDVMDWKPGNSKHDRKFMLTRGSLVDEGQDHQSVALGFWGEWEGPSEFWKLGGSPGRPSPSVVHAPFRPASRPTKPIQNTDPMVFGDAFVYSNCLASMMSNRRRLPSP
jgi:hypothetical protein